MKYHFRLLLKSKCDSGFGHFSRKILYAKNAINTTSTLTLSSNIIICGNKQDALLMVFEIDNFI